MTPVQKGQNIACTSESGRGCLKQTEILNLTNEPFIEEDSDTVPAGSMLNKQSSSSKKLRRSAMHETLSRTENVIADEVFIENEPSNINLIYPENKNGPTKSSLAPHASISNDTLLALKPPVSVKVTAKTFSPNIQTPMKSIY